MRLTVLLTSPRVAAGLLTRTAWQVLEAADEVLVRDAATARALEGQGVPCTLLPDGGDLGSRPGPRPAQVVLVTPDPDDPAARTGGVAEVERLDAAYDVPGARVLDLVAVMDRLRVGCPWDREQTHRSLARYLLEEAHETLEAIETGDDAHLREELGDLLLQVVFHARIASERGAGGFDLDDVATGISEKLVYRHPHVFADVEVADADEVDRNWESLKAAEKQRTSPVDGIPASLPALALADKVLGRLAKAGERVDWAADPSPVGRALLDVVAGARAAGADSEQELREAVRRLLADRASLDGAGQKRV